MIRPTMPEDTPSLVELARATGVFKPLEIQALGEVLDDYHATNHAEGHYARTLERDGQVLGFVYYAQTAMTDRSWSLWWIAVTKADHGKGLGTEMLKAVEDDVRRRNGRVLFIETSSLPNYEPTRRFYLKHGYEVTGVMQDYYADGDDMVVFRKGLS